MRARGLAADLLVANNVLAHVPDLHDFVAGLAALLKSAGTLSIEFPHLLRLIEEVQFDTIYHEHFCYFSLAPVERLLSEHGLKVFDIEQLPTHGGSLRVLAAPVESQRAEGPGLAAVRSAERAAGLDRIASYGGFEPKVSAVCAELTSFLETARRDGKKTRRLRRRRQGQHAAERLRHRPASRSPSPSTPAPTSRAATPPAAIWRSARPRPWPQHAPTTCSSCPGTCATS